MADFITNMVTDTIKNSVGGMLTGAVSTAGGYAGSAVNGFGNLIEGAGERVGNGMIGGSFQSVGDGISGYGQSIMNATAPNASSGQMKRIDPKSRPASQKALPASKSSTQKALPSSISKPAQKTLPSSTTKPLKALPAPAPASVAGNGKKDLPKPKEGYKPFTPTEKTGYKPFTPTKPAYSPYQAPASASAASTTAGAAKKPQHEPIKSRTLSSGKVVASPVSKPRPSNPPPGAKTPTPAKPPSKAGSTFGGHIPGASGSNKAVPGKAGSVIGSGPAQRKGFGGHIPGVGAGASKPVSRAPTVVGVGGKTAPAPSKAGSVVGGSAGPKFF